MDDKTLVGLTEPVTIFGKNKKNVDIIARIDSGATVSSIDKALVDELSLGPIIKTRITKQVHGETERPVIKVRIKLANRKFNFRFTIADRQHMKYKMLIGQNILKKDFLIDPSRR